MLAHTILLQYKLLVYVRALCMVRAPNRNMKILTTAHSSFSQNKKKQYLDISPNSND